MKREYNDVRNKADQLQSRMNGCWDERKDGKARDLQQKAIDLREFIESDAHPDKLEHLADDLYEEFNALARSGSNIMSMNDTQGFRSEYQKLAHTFKGM